MSCNDDDSTPNAPVINSCVNNKTVALDSEGNFTLPNYTTDGDLDYTSSNNLDFIFFWKNLLFTAIEKQRYNIKV